MKHSYLDLWIRVHGGVTLTGFAGFGIFDARPE